ncbi:MAG: DUF4129 domain-containing protein [Kouleothrix sp.]|nr:DUF4129 domain-containing protein [Kouleothrix sp.]
MMKLNRVGLVLNAVMLAGLVAVIGGPFHRFRPDWQPIYMVAASFLVAAEAGLVHHIFRRDHMWLDELARYIVPELFVMVILMRVASSLSIGTATLAESARRWLYDPLSVFDALFVGSLVIGLLIWLFAHAGMRDLFELEPRQFDAVVDRDEPQMVAVLARQDRSAALSRISARFVLGGALMLLALGLEAVNIDQITGPSLPISALSGAAALLYMMSGFLLYSQARLALLRARWRLEGARVSEELPRRWNRISWLIIGGVVGGATLLPRSYGLGLLTTILRSLGLLGYGIAIVGYFLTSLLSLLVILPVLLLSWLTGGSLGGGARVPPPLIPRPETPPAGTFEPRLLTSIVFWLCMLALAIYALAIVVQRNPALVHAVTTRGPIAWLLRRVAFLWRDTRSWAGMAVERARAVLRRRAADRQARIPSLRLGRLAPRELVRYFYRSTLRRAAAGGLARRASQTPYEYEATLGGRLPDAQPDIAELTESFVQAEYSPRPVGPEDARRARRPWERVRRRLRGLSE